MRKILIPTDFSDNAMNAIKYATELFKHGPTEIYLLHAFSDSVYEDKARLADAVFEELQEKADSQLFPKSKTYLAYHSRIWPVGGFGKRLGRKGEYRRGGYGHQR